MPHRSRVILDLESDSSQISGSIAAEGLQPRSFYGWLDLMAALDSARGDDPGGAGDRQAAQTEVSSGPGRAAVRRFGAAPQVSPKEGTS